MGPLHQWLPVIVLAWFLVPAAVRAQQPAFPGAEGAGWEALGGRGGQVYEVTNLDDDGPGSLREAVEASGARIVVFRVGGNIELASTLSIRNPYITIAGQSAPGDGICLKNFGLSIRANHVQVRYLRVRPGDNEGQEVDSISITEGEHIIVDHCSASWSVDETLSASTGDQLDKVTVQWCLISEALDCSVHSKGCHGYGSLIRGAWGNEYTFHHNLYAHHRARLPRPGNYNDHVTDPSGFLFDFRNNVVYNWGGSSAGYNSDDDSITRSNFVGNYYLTGPDSDDDRAYNESCLFAQAYFSDNYMDGVLPGDPWSLVSFSGFSAGEEAAYKLASPLPTAAVTTEDAAVAQATILAEVGCSFPVRDAVDQRIISDVQNGTGGIIDDEDEVGGWPALASGTPPLDTDHDGMPDDWELPRGLDPADPADGPGDRDSDGYTNVEEFLNCLVDICDDPQPGQDAGVPGPDSGSPGVDAAPPQADADAPAADAGTTPPDSVDSGCGCSKTTDSSPLLWALLFLLGLLFRRRQ